MEYNINHSECKGLHRPGRKRRDRRKGISLDKQVNGMKKNIPTVKNYISFAVTTEKHDGFVPYEEALRRQVRKNLQ